MKPAAHAALLIATVAALAALFAMVEIQIEGSVGWGASLPTWQVQDHWLLDVLWGGRAMTGYHAWVFPFVVLVFHLPFALVGMWSWRLESRALGCLMWFWIVEDGLWFALNPAFGWSALNPERATWHPHWLFGLPLEYTLFGLLGTGLIGWSFRPSRIASPTRV